MAYVEDENSVVWDEAVAVHEFGAEYVQQNFRKLSINETILFENQSALSNEFFRELPLTPSAVKHSLAH